MRHRRAVLVLSLVLGVSRAAVAQEVPSTGEEDAVVEELTAKGVSLRKAGQDAEALALFERALALHPSPRGVAQAALAHQALAEWREAERGLLDALRDPSDPWIARNRAYLEQSLATAQTHLSWLDVESNVAGGEVRIGGEPSGHLPLDAPVRIVAGEVTVEVRVPGYAPIERTLRVEGGSHFHTEFLFAPTPPPGTPVKPETIPAVAPAERQTGRRTVGWGALATAGGLALVGVAGALTRQWEAGVYNDDVKCGDLPGQPRSVRCGSNRDIGNAAETVGLVAFAGSGVAAAISGVLLFGRSRSKPAVAARRFDCGVAGVGLVCGGAF